MKINQPASRADRMARAARPTLFDAAADPGLMVAMLLANLTSPALWEFEARIAARIAAENRPLSPGEIMLAIQAYTDQHLFHISPLGVADTWGLLDLEEERERLGAEVVDYAVAEMVTNLRARRQWGSLTDEQDVIGLIEAGRFPEYHYSNIDIIRAYPRLLGRRKHKPLGVTTCADEAVLMASLSSVLRTASVGEAVILGAPVHYTLLISHAGETCWLNGKHEGYTSADWARFVADLDPEAVRLEVATRMDCDRIVASAGAYVLPDAQTDLPPPHLDAVCSRLDAFFTTTLDWVAQIRAHPPRFLDSPLAAFDWTQFDALSDPAAARTLLRRLAHELPGSVFEAALYAARDLAVDQPELYLTAGERGHLVRTRAKQITGIDDALDLLRRVEGRDSAVACAHRIALPDEVLKFNTGDAQDRAFLLCTLLGLADALPKQVRADREVLLGRDGAYVRLGKTYIDAATLIQTPRMPTEPTLRIVADARLPPTTDAT
jgi:hypothetical protein